jgi:hypothetical protein
MSRILAAELRTMPRTRNSARRITLLTAVLFCILFPATPPAGAARIPIAVIVHEQVPVDGLSLSELRRIFLGERQLWARGLTVTLLMPPHGSPERKVLLRQIYKQRTEIQYQHHWINKLFGDGAQITPKITGSPEMSASLAREIPGAIALVRANRIPEGVKILSIDGKLPGESDYPLVA